MRRDDYRKLEMEFSRMILDFWIENDIPTEWLLRLLVEEASKHTERVTEWYEEHEEQERMQREMEE